MEAAKAGVLLDVCCGVAEHEHVNTRVTFSALKAAKPCTTKSQMTPTRDRCALDQVREHAAHPHLKTDLQDLGTQCGLPRHCGKYGHALVYGAALLIFNRHILKAETRSISKCTK
jgi:hypothetical protein